MTRLSLWLLIVALFPAGGSPDARAQTALALEGGARAAALGGAATALPDGTWGFANPAAWSTPSGRRLAFYAVEGFGLSEMRLAALNYVEPTRWGAFSAGVRSFGFEAYRESVLGLGYARGFRLGTSRRFHVGLAARYHHLTLGSNTDGGSYGNSGAAAVSVGALVHVLPRLLLGTAATNVNGSGYTASDPLPQTIAFGLAYHADERLWVTTDVFKDIDFPASVRAGVEVTPVQAVALRIGAATAPTRMTGGVGLRLRRLRARLAFERHETLGWTPAAELALAW